MTAENSQVDKSLNELRQQLLIFILDELSSRVGTAPVVQLPKALADAIDAEVGRAVKARLAQANLPDPVAFRDELFAQARLGGDSQAARDAQMDAIAAKIAILIGGVEQLVASQGGTFDTQRPVSDEEVEALGLARTDADRSDPIAGGPDRSIVGGDGSGDGHAPKWSILLKGWLKWLMAGLACVALGVAGALLYQSMVATSEETPEADSSVLTPIPQDSGDMGDPNPKEGALPAEAPPVSDAGLGSSSSGGAAANKVRPTQSMLAGTQPEPKAPPENPAAREEALPGPDGEVTR